MKKALLFLAVLLTTATAWADTGNEADGVYYMDADGNMKNTATDGIDGNDTPTVLDGGGATTLTTDKWYVVNHDITYTGQITYASGEVTIILCDNCTMNIGTSASPINSGYAIDGYDLTIYGQRLNSTADNTIGQLNVFTTNKIVSLYLRTYTQYSGIVNIDGNDYCIDTNAFTQYGGKLSATTGRNDVISVGTKGFAFYGGQLDATGTRYAIMSMGSITLGWKCTTDYIYASTTSTEYSSYYAADGITVADGQTLTDGTTIYSGTITAANIEKKKLVAINTNDFSINGDSAGYTIHTADGWNALCDYLQDNDTWNHFSGKTVKLGDDISVTRMAGMTGDSSHPFCGTFDGCGKTLTFNYSGSEDFIAPFSWTIWNNSPIFRNLTVSGTINTTGSYAAGLVGHLYGEVTVEHCTSNVDITCASGAGGFVGLCEHTVNFSDCLSSAVIHSKGGNNSGFVGWSRASGHAINFMGCVFKGKLLQIDGEGGINGGFIGWTGSNKTVTITDCLVNTATLADGETMASGSTATFARGWNATTTATNCYYTAALGAPQCTQARSITAGEYVTVDNAGKPETVYATSGITAYPTGIKYNDVLYAGNGDEVSLTLNHADREGYEFVGYEASAGTLSGSENPYTLTMPDGQVTVSAKFSKAPVSTSYVDADGVVHDNVEAIPLDETMTSLGEDEQETWYVASGTLNYTETLNIAGDVHLILANGAVMNIGTEAAPVSGYGIDGSEYYSDLTIYGQTLDDDAAGHLNINTDDDCIYVAGDYAQHSGNVTLNSSNGCGFVLWYNFTFTGGTLYVTAKGNAIYPEDNVDILGGKLSAVSVGNYYGINSTSGVVTFGWKNIDDEYTVSSFAARVKIADGQAFTDGENIYDSTTPKEVFLALTNVTLRPLKRGDLNGDGTVDVSDLNIMVNIILGKATADACVTTPDLNDDNEVDVSDINLLVNIILGK